VSDIVLLRSLLTDCRVLVLAVLDGTAPAIGLLPFALDPSGPALIVHASALARHSRGLWDGAPFDALVARPEGPGIDPFRIPRLTVRGRVVALAPGSGEEQAAHAIWSARFPDARGLLGFGDFRTSRLEIERGRLVAGFAAARDVDPEEIRHLG